MDRTQASEVCDVGSIPTEDTMGRSFCEMTVLPRSLALCFLFHPSQLTPFTFRFPFADYEFVETLGPLRFFGELQHAD